MNIPDRYGRWERAPGSLHWYCKSLPGWCVTGTFGPDPRGVYRRRFYAQYHGVTVGEVLPAATPQRVMDELDDLLGRAYRSPKYVRGLRSVGDT